MLPDIKKRIEYDFGKLAPLAFYLIEGYLAVDDVGPRVQRCLVKMAEGDTDKLSQAIRMAKTDWRDVIMAGETYTYECNEPFK